MSKADEIRALREAKVKAAGKARRGAGAVRSKLPAEAPPVVVKQLQTIADGVKSRVPVSSHPDCAECARRREQTRLRVARHRAGVRDAATAEGVTLS